MMNSSKEIFDQFPEQKEYNLISSLPQNAIARMPSRKKVSINVMYNLKLGYNLNLSLAQIQPFKRD